MLGLIFIYFIGKTYYTLAQKHKKEQLWLWAISGIVAYYLGAFIGGIILGVFVLLLDLDVDLENIGLGLQLLIGLGGGLGGTTGFYQFLKYKWDKTESLAMSDDVLDDDFITENTSSKNFLSDDFSSEDYLDDSK